MYWSLAASKAVLGHTRRAVRPAADGGLQTVAGAPHNAVDVRVRKPGRSRAAGAALFLICERSGLLRDGMRRPPPRARTHSRARKAQLKREARERRHGRNRCSLLRLLQKSRYRPTMPSARFL